ncbi:MAG: L-histidine N(alpha)-methyltransferase [Planctomycetota bacterium]|nr:L-histidine N(alpha)-methyltransferase [Planctomycetota bacterium]
MTPETKQNLADPDSEAAEIRASLMRGLPEIPCRFLYDETGSELFEQITHQPEYYQTRTELAILEAHARDIGKIIRPLEYVELGAGSGRKTDLLLGAMDTLECCVLTDISEDFLKESVARLRVAHPNLQLRGLTADFLSNLGVLGQSKRRLITLLAGTLGNLHPGAVPGFLRRVAQQLTPEGGFLVGIDLIKDPARIEAAYNDRAGVTATFNKNILSVINKRFEADFPLDAFEHRARYDTENSWVDIRLQATRPVDIHAKALDLKLRFNTGEEIRTELSCKYSPESFAAVAQDTGLKIREIYSDNEGLFANILMVREDG